MIHDAPEAVPIEKTTSDAYDHIQLECDLDDEGSIIMLSEAQFNSRFPNFSEPAKREADQSEATPQSDSHRRNSESSGDSEME